MKKIFSHIITFSAIIAGLLSCAKPMEWVDPEGPYSDGKKVLVPFEFNFADKTKVTDASRSDENEVTRWTVFAFDDSDSWMSYASAEKGEPITLRLWQNRQYTCYAFVNYNIVGKSAFSPSTIRSADELLNRVVVLGDNTPGRLMAFGSKVLVPVGQRPPVTEGEEEEKELVSDKVTINVGRLLSRIEIPGIRVNFDDENDAPEKFILRGVYVTNTYRTNRLGSDYKSNELSGVRGAWYNSGGLHAGENPVETMDDLLVEDDLKVTLSQSKPFLTPLTFYAFPNVTSKEDDDTQMALWTRRCTRVVIKAQLDGEMNYYQMDIPEMRRNRVYRLSGVVIRGRGGKEEEYRHAPEGAIEYELDEYPFSWDDPENEIDADFEKDEY